VVNDDGSKSKSIVNVQRDVNTLIEAKILKSRHGYIWPNKHYQKQLKVIASRAVENEIVVGFLDDLVMREKQISEQTSQKWIEFFLAVVAVIQIIPYLCSLIALNESFEILAMVLFSIVIWFIIFNRAYYNKHPILIPIEIQNLIARNEFDATEYRKHSQIQTSMGLKLMDELEINKGDVLLDAGCADGRLTFEIFNRHKNLLGKIIGVDISASQINAAKQSFLEHSIDSKLYEFYRQNLLDIDLLGVQFNKIYSNATLHWVGANAYKKLYDVLLPNGTLLIEQAGNLGYFRLHNTCLQVIENLGLSHLFEKFDIQQYYYAPLESELTKWLEDIGYVDITIRTIKVSNLPDIYEQFATASLFPYYRFIEDNSVRVMFKSEFLKLCEQNEPSTESNRFIIHARKPASTST
jgi:ubiquinone/menaquinone biosynthesis C-methylase UbiE